MNVRFAAALTLALALAPAAAAWAGCLQGDLKGTWRLYAIGANSSSLYTLRCQVTVAANGNLTTGSCTDDTGGSGPVTGGRLRVNSSCTVTGDVEVDDNPLLGLDHATLDLGRRNMAGVGEDNTGGLFHLSGVKR